MTDRSLEFWGNTAGNAGILAIGTMFGSVGISNWGHWPNWVCVLLILTALRVIGVNND